MTTMSLYQPARLSAVARLLYLEERVSAEFSTIARATAIALGVRAAAVNLVLTSSVAIIGSHGMPDWVREAGGLPSRWGPCADVIERGDAVLLPDLARRYADLANPIVVADGLRSYAGVPLRFAGEVVGAFCVFDDRPASLTPETLSVLACVGDHIVRNLFPG